MEIQLSASNLILNLTPKAETPVFGSTDLTITVGTSGAAGYTLMMNTNNTNLTSSTNETIDTLAEDEDGYTCTTESCNFTVNHWGFKKSTDTTYNYVPTSVELASNDAPTNGDPTTINFASRVDATQPAGSYSTTLTFVATVNPTSISNISEIEYLQDFANLTGDELSNVKSSMTASTNYTKQDSRDSQDYTIALLPDGKIWMTKNLNLAGGAEIESTKSDVPANYTLPTANNFQSGNKLPASATAGFNDDTKAFVYNTNNNTDNCANPGCYSYYSWTAATAGSGLSITTDNTSALYSICPKGWKLPSTYYGTDSTSANFDFRALMIAYGGSSSVQTYNTSSNPTGATMYGKIGPTTTVPKFLLTGRYGGGSFSNGGSDGYYWSSTSYNSTSARGLLFGSTSVNSASNNFRRYGFAIRCIVAE